MSTLILYLALFLCTMGCHAGEPRSHAADIGPGRHTLRLTVDGFERTCIVHVPPSYNSKSHSPVVVMLHGGGGTAKAAIRETGWTEKADKEGFLAVFPNALSRNPSRRSSFAKNPQLWNDASDRFYPGQTNVDDVHFLSALLDELSKRFTVDKRRVFVTGFSNGASMSFLAGAQLSNRIAAIAPVAGACWFEPATLKGPVPMLYITGNADPLNPIEGGVPKLASGASDKVRGKAKPPVQESILRWARAIGCPMPPASVDDIGGVRTEIYSPCSNGTQIVFISIDDLGHTWAGGRSLLPERLVGNTSNRISATDVIWDFFRENPRSTE